MNAAHRRYVVLEQGVGAVIVNFLLNGAIAWAAFRGMSSIPMWGAQSIAGDTIATAFVLPFLTCLIVTPLARREVARGRLPSFEHARGAYPLLSALPATTFRRALVLGTAATAVAAPIAIVAFSAVRLGGITAADFIWVKAGFAAVLAGVVAPLVALAALADTFGAGVELTSATGPGATTVGAKEKIT